MSSPTIRLLPRHLRPLTQQYHRSIPVSLSTKSYHSYDRPSSSDSPFPPTETSILRASVPHIPTHGFTLNTLSLGAQDVGYIPAATNLFPKGAFSLAHYHLYTQRLALKNHTELIAPPPETEGEEPPKGVGRRVKALTWERLLGNKDIIHKWQKVRNFHFKSLSHCVPQKKPPNHIQYNFTIPPNPYPDLDIATFLQSHSYQVPQPQLTPSLGPNTSHPAHQSPHLPPRTPFTLR